MTQEDKQLLLIDLCARSPYDIMVEHPTLKVPYPISQIHSNGDVIVGNNKMGLYSIYISICKPYLRPMSDMTEEEKEELFYRRDKDFSIVRKWCKEQKDPNTDAPSPVTCGEVDFCNERHLDYRGLIEKGLAIKVTEENNPYKTE